MKLLLQEKVKEKNSISSTSWSSFSAFGFAAGGIITLETASHEMGHQLGLFHTTESGGTEFDILTDTPECPKNIRDNDSNGKISTEEYEGYGGNNLLFWSAWSSASQSAGKKQETLSCQQQHVLKYSPLAK